MKLKMLASAIFLIVVSCSNDNKRFEIDIDDFCGVWANANCELVKTGLYELLFERYENKMMASIRLFSREENKLLLNTRGITLFDTLTHKAIIKAKDLIFGENIAVSNDIDNILRLDTLNCKIQKYPDMLVLSSNGKVIEELARSEKQIRLLSPSGNWHSLDPVEKLQVTSPYEVIKATDKYLGTCLQQWQLGTSFMVDSGGKVNAIEIGTNKHSYVFTYNQEAGNLTIYCRAARIRSDNDGTVFAQNIRMMSNPREFAAFMYPDNEEITSQNIVMADSLFKPNVCTFTSDAIYWSLKSFNDTMIVLNGCGEDYTYTRPHVDSGRIIEWFEFTEY